MYYYGYSGGYGNNYGMNQCCPAYGYGNYGFLNAYRYGAAIILVLFILFVVVFYVGCLNCKYNKI